MTAQKLAHVDKAGEGESEVDLFHPRPGVFSKIFCPGGGHLERPQGKLHGFSQAKVLHLHKTIIFQRPFIHSRSCDEEESESVVEVAEEGDGTSNEEETSEEADAGEEETGEAAERKGAETSSREGINWEALTLEQQQRQPRRIRGSLGILRMPQAELARVFQSISLDSFTLLSTGTTSRP